VNLPAGCDLGVATHSGRVRTGNEDDYLVLVLPGAGGGLLVGLADGMGGVAGGAEASRLALRGLAGVLIAAPPGDHESDVRAAFAGACRRVAEQAAMVPTLAGMGTTLTMLLVRGDRLVLGHVGDSRAYRLRSGKWSLMTTDHALREPDNVLLRCVGGGALRVDPDVAVHAIEPDDRWLLCSDGVWSTVPEETAAAVVARFPAQAAADRLVALALAAGGPDNATAVVVHFGLPLPARPVELPREEASRAGELTVQQPLQPALWPIVVLVLAAIGIALAMLRWLHGFDLLRWLRQGTS
jgi:protein phosphatase